jgi:hypothetical protein
MAQQDPKRPTAFITGCTVGSVIFGYIAYYFYNKSQNLRRQMADITEQGGVQTVDAITKDHAAADGKFKLIDGTLLNDQDSLKHLKPLLHTMNYLENVEPKKFACRATEFSN